MKAYRPETWIRLKKTVAKLDEKQRSRARGSNLRSVAVGTAETSADELVNQTHAESDFDTEMLTSADLAVLPKFTSI